MNLNDTIKKIDNIFSLPKVVVSVNKILNSSDPDISELEAIILHDPALTIKILKIVNSSYFGLPSKINTVSRAITMLGLQELRNVIMGVSIASQFRNIPNNLVDMETFWYHSIFKGVLTKTLAKHYHYKDHERFYIAGLLSSIGKLILFSQYPEQMKSILKLTDQSDANIINEEKNAFGFDHAELCAELLRVWQLPDDIWQTVLYQFDPLNDNAQKHDACLLHVAGKIANTIQPCHNKISLDPNDKKPKFNDGISDFLQLTTEVIDESTTEALLYPREILNIILP